MNVNSFPNDGSFMQQFQMQQGNSMDTPPPPPPAPPPPPGGFPTPPQPQQQQPQQQAWGNATQPYQQQQWYPQQQHGWPAQNHYQQPYSHFQPPHTGQQPHQPGQPQQPQYQQPYATQQWLQQTLVQQLSRQMQYPNQQQPQYPNQQPNQPHFPQAPYFPAHPMPGYPPQGIGLTLSYAGQPSSGPLPGTGEAKYPPMLPPKFVAIVSQQSPDNYRDDRERERADWEGEKERERAERKKELPAWLREELAEMEKKKADGGSRPSATSQPRPGRPESILQNLSELLSSSSSEEEPELSPEERERLEMQTIRSILSALLLEVTDDIIQEECATSYQESKFAARFNKKMTSKRKSKKGQVTPLPVAKPKPAGATSLLALVTYSSEDEEEEERNKTQNPAGDEVYLSEEGQVSSSEEELTSTLNSQLP